MCLLCPYACGGEIERERERERERKRERDSEIEKERERDRARKRKTERKSCCMIIRIQRLFNSECMERDKQKERWIVRYRAQEI